MLDADREDVSFQSEKEGSSQGAVAARLVLLSRAKEAERIGKILKQYREYKEENIPARIRRFRINQSINQSIHESIDQAPTYIRTQSSKSFSSYTILAFYVNKA